MKPTLSEWGSRAADRYTRSYAREYRLHDETLDSVGAYETFCAWLGQICDRCGPDLEALDLGCGTGRYFRALSHVRSLVGIDASAAMLDEARRPIGAERIAIPAIDLVHADFLAYDFGPNRFDLVYSIGVLAEHTPLDRRIVENVHRWLRPGGRFAFSTVHPDSPSVPRTVGRAMGRLLLPLAWGPVRQRLHDRLTADGLYADDTRICALLESTFTIESLELVHSEAHLHALCVARKRQA